MIRQIYRDKVRLRRDRGRCNWVGQGRTGLGQVSLGREVVRSHDRS